MTAILDSRWDLERVRSQFTTKLPLAALLGVEVVAAEPPTHASGWSVRRTSHVPAVCFAMAELASCALTLVLPRRRMPDLSSSYQLLSAGA